MITNYEETDTFIYIKSENWLVGFKKGTVDIMEIKIPKNTLPYAEQLLKELEEDEEKTNNWIWNRNR